MTAVTPTVCDASHVKNMNMNKEVATRLFRMLAVSEATANTIKRDHASYAKLNLLTQQAQLLQAQATQTVSKSVTKAQADGEITLRETCTALSTEFDEGAKRLLTIMAVDEQTVATVKRDAPASAKLSLLAEQCGLLQQQAQQALSESETNSHLYEVAARVTCKLVAGTMYYHYTQHGQEVLSRIADDEWTSYDEYHGKYLYDWDLTFRRQVVGSEQPEQPLYASAAPMLMLPNIVATPTTTAGCAEDHEMAEAAPLPPQKPVERVLSRW